MEENTKTVKLGEQPKEEKKELSYTELQDVAEKLFNQNKQFAAQNSQLKQQLQAVNESRFLTRLDFQIRIVDIANKGGEYRFSPEFIDKTIAEIEESMTIKEESNGGEQEKQGNE